MTDTVSVFGRRLPETAFATISSMAFTAPTWALATSAKAFYHLVLRSLIVDILAWDVTFFVLEKLDQVTKNRYLTETFRELIGTICVVICFAATSTALSPLFLTSGSIKLFVIADVTASLFSTFLINTLSKL